MRDDAAPVNLAERWLIKQKARVQEKGQSLLLLIKLQGAAVK